MSEYDFQSIEKKWQGIWEEEQTFAVDNLSDPARPEFYCLEMLPYPSGRLHMGHVRNYTIGDAVARFKAARGFKVLHPMGWDSFGLPAENAAIKRKIHPRIWTEENIAQMRQQLRRMGYAYDWSREIAAHRPEFYRWNQWFFLKMLERGLAYRANRQVNWCSNCQTVLANEQVVQGVCWRCDTPVVRRSLEQWFLRITDYAGELDAYLPRLTGWSERVRQMQKHWIGRSEGALVRFPVEAEGVEPLEIFTTRLDTIYGATFCVLAPEHPAVKRLAEGTPEQQRVAVFAERMAKRDLVHQDADLDEKEGVFTGRYARNPYTAGRIPIWVGNFVLMEYGTGAIMAVPGNDERDHQFARQYSLPILPVVRPADPSAPRPPGDGAFTELGVLVDSGPYTGMNSADAMEAMLRAGEEQGFAKRATQYRIRDWGISRQRYWGTPIPVVHCQGCGIVPVPEKDLPVVLPDDVEFTGEGGSPLARSPSFVKVDCPRCGKPARRETDTMDTFFDSSWYFYRYADAGNDREPFDPAVAKHWFPIDQYIGGITHAILHLIYCRFFTRAMRDMGLVGIDEPVVRLLNQGMVLKDGTAMSKSKGNVVEPDAMVARYGADTCRLFTLFASPPERDLEWNEQGVEGCHRFLERVWRLAVPWFGSEAAEAGALAAATSERETALRRKTHQTILRVTEDLDRRLHFNTAIAAVMELVNEVSLFAQGGTGTPSEKACLREALNATVQLLSPFAPHFAEEVWERLGGTPRLSSAGWPAPDLALAEAPLVEVVVQVNGRLRGKVSVERGTGEAEVLDRARSDPRVEAHLKGKSVAKTIFVADRLLNIVVRG